MSYRHIAPSWSRPPQHAWSLDEIKHGHVLSTHSLNDIIPSATSNAAMVTFGRDDRSLIVTAHESCSRHHARIAFDDRGVPWLRDLGSGNGTFVNNKRMPPQACGKEDVGSSQKRGSRGVVLYPGDAIRFGASTRTYLLEGPQEFERGAMKLKRETANEKSPATTTHDDEEGGCSWGMSEDAIDTEQEQEQPSSGHVNAQNPNLALPSIESFFCSSHKISDALLKLRSQYNGKMHKLENLQTESSRILRKESSTELTDGQRNQLKRNAERQQTLEKEIGNLKERIESGMHMAIHGKARAKTNKPSAEEGDDDDDNNFYDLTTSTERKRADGNHEAESESSLIGKWKSLLEGYPKQHQAVSRASQCCDELQRRIDNTGNEEDEDAFFLQNDLALANDNLAKAQKAKEETEKELDEVEYLLEIVNPKLRWNRNDGWIGTGDVKARSEVAVAPNKDKGQSREAVIERDSMMPPPPPMTLASAPSSNSSISELTKHHATATSKDENSTCNDHVEVDGTNTTTKQSRKEKRKRPLGPTRPSPGAVQGTLATLTQAVSRPKLASTGASTQRSEKTTKATVSTPFDSRKDEWKAPSGQDGSGRTALHDKFNGRY